MKSHVISSFGNLKQFAIALFQNPFGAESRTEWQHVFAWIRRPLVLAMFLVPSLALVLWRYAEHQAFVLKVFKSWETYDGVMSGTGFIISQSRITIETIFAMTTIGITAIAGWGTAETLRQGNWVATDKIRRIKKLAAALRIWMMVSVFWPIWLTGLNIVGAKSMNPVGVSYGGVFDDLFAFPMGYFLGMVAIYFFGGLVRIGNTGDSDKSRNQKMASHRILHLFINRVGLVILTRIPFEIDFDGYTRVCYKDPFALQLPYLAVSCLLLPFWLKRVLSQNPAIRGQGAALS